MQQINKTSKIVRRKKATLPKTVKTDGIFKTQYEKVSEQIVTDSYIDNFLFG